MNLHANAVRYLRKILQWPIDGFEITTEEARKGLEYLGPTKRSEKVKTYRRAARAKDTEKIAARSMSTKEIRAACMERAKGQCECGCGRYFNSCVFFLHAQLDHWEGGRGRKRERQSVETCWMLTRQCHGWRSDNNPSAAHWNERRRWHCLRHDYLFVGHVEHRALPGRGAA